MYGIKQSQFYKLSTLTKFTLLFVQIFLFVTAWTRSLAKRLQQYLLPYGRVHPKFGVLGSKGVGLNVFEKTPRCPIKFNARFKWVCQIFENSVTRPSYMPDITLLTLASCVRPCFLFKIPFRLPSSTLFVIFHATRRRLVWKLSA